MITIIAMIISYIGGAISGIVIDKYSQSIEADKTESEKNVQIDKQTLWDRAGTSNHITRADVNVRPPKDNSGTQALNEGYTPIANKYS